MENTNSNNKEPRCLSCEKYQTEPRLGHTNCSGHRKCNGKHLWEPNNCEHCLVLREQYNTMPREERNAFLQDLRVMLERMNFNNKARGIQWEYRMIVASFFETNCPSTATPASDSGENRESPSDYCDNYMSDGNNFQANDNEGDNVQGKNYDIPDLEQAINGLDRDTLLSMLQASLQKAGGGTSVQRQQASEDQKHP